MNVEIGSEVSEPSKRPGRARGLVGYRDRAQRTHFGLTWRSGVSHLTGDTLIDILVAQAPLQACEPGYLMLALIFEGIVADIGTLRAAWLALGTTYRVGRHACLDWVDDEGRQQRRMLGAVTVLSAHKQKRSSHFDTAAAQLLDTISSRYGLAPDLETLLAIARIRLVTALPGDLMAHIIGDHPLSAVPRSCVARLTARQALADNARADSTKSALPNQVRARIADAMFVTDATSDAGDARRLIRAIAQACHADSNQPNAALDCRRMLRALEALAPECEFAGGWTCALWSWAVDLVARGTDRTQPLSPHTIDPYTSLTLEPLLGALSGVHVDHAEIVDWPALYVGIVESPEAPLTQRGKIAAALSAWHEFLVDACGVAPLSHSLDPAEQTLLPRANVVWPHEQAWVFRHLAENAQKSRIDAQLAAVAAIAMSSAVRAEDIWHIHMFGVSPSDDALTLHIDPLPFAGTGKSRNARRSIEVTEQKHRETLQGWCARRQAEGALDDDLLFGDPSQGHRAHRRGSTLGALNAWLKRATGDTGLSMHTLRHSSLSLLRVELAGGEQRRLDEASARAGHGSTQMSLDHYVHLYECALREALDTLLDSRPLTERQACAMSGLKPGCLRQRQRRNRLARRDAAGLAWDAINAAALAVSMPDASEGIAMKQPQPLVSEDLATLTPSNLLSWLEDLARDIPSEVVAMRYDLGPEHWQSLRSGIKAWSRQTGQRASKPEAWASLTQMIPFRAGFEDLGQDKYLPLVQAFRRTGEVGVLASALDSWGDQLRGEHIRIDGADSVRGLLTWMQRGGISGRQIVVCHEAGCESDALDAAGLSEEIFLEPAALRSVQARSGRPPVYLMLRSNASNSRPYANAAMSILGLHALLFTAWLWLRLNSGALAHA